MLLAFKGTQLDWITMKGTTGGTADIYVDGSPTKAATIDLYQSPAVYKQNVWSTGTLPDGYHTVKIMRSTSSAVGRYLTIDAVEVAGTLVSPTRIEENASLSPFTWNPTSWTTGSTTSASGGTYKYINTAGAYVSFSFTGVGFHIIAKTAPSYGNLTVTVDGVSQTVSLYSSSTADKKVVLTKFLTPGTHTVKITRRGPRAVRPRVTPSTLMPSICMGWRGRAADYGRTTERECPLLRAEPGFVDAVIRPDTQ